MTKKKPPSSHDFDERELLVDLMARTSLEAARRRQTPSGIFKIITNDTRLWGDLMARKERLDMIAAAREAGGPKTGDQTAGKTRSISLEMRDRLLAGLDKLEAEKIETETAA